MSYNEADTRTPKDLVAIIDKKGDFQGADYAGSRQLGTLLHEQR